MLTGTTRAAPSRASAIDDAPIAGRLRAAVTCLPTGDRRHLILVYDPADHLVCWCGPYTPEEQLNEATRWGNAGWRWAGVPRGNQLPASTLKLGDVTVRIS